MPALALYAADYPRGTTVVNPVRALAACGLRLVTIRGRLEAIREVQS